MSTERRRRIGRRRRAPGEDDLVRVSEQRGGARRRRRRRAPAAQERPGAERDGAEDGHGEESGEEQRRRDSGGMLRVVPMAGGDDLSSCRVPGNGESIARRGRRGLCSRGAGRAMREGDVVRTGQRELDELVPRIRAFLEQDVLEVTIDGERIRGYRSPDAKSIWIRDHSRHDARVQVLRARPHERRRALRRHPGRRTAGSSTTSRPSPRSCRASGRTGPSTSACPSRRTSSIRFVKAAFLAWQATGDDAWIRALLPAARAGARATRAPTPGAGTRSSGSSSAPTPSTRGTSPTPPGRTSGCSSRSTTHTFWGIFHGDNSGYYEAYRLLAALYAHFGDDARAALWRERAARAARRP